MKFLRILAFGFLFLGAYQAGINNQQSEACRPDDRVQCLSVMPKDVYSVFLGDKVELPCTIRNLQGRVQWRAGNVLLGWERDIPSRSRFRVIGNEELGENTLQITGVEASDIGEYECQVGPSGDHPLLRRRTTLQVLIPPEKPRIHESPNSPAVDTIIVNRPDKALILNLICRSKGGNPPPIFTWSINGENINGEGINNGKYLIHKEVKRYNIEVTPGADSDEIHLQISRASLKDGDEISCKAWNKANEWAHTELHSLVTTAIVRIYTEIGDPRISQEYSQELIRENDTLKVICTASPPGNPTGNIHWRWELNESLQKKLNPNGFNLRQEDISPTHYQNTIENNSLRSVLIIKQIPSKYHGATLVCMASHHLTQKIKRESLKIKILYPPKNVRIETIDNIHKIERGPDLSEQVINARMNAIIKLQCNSDWFYKNARLRWILSPEESKGRPEDIEHDPAKLIPASDSESYSLQSHVEIRMLKEYNGGYIDCQSWYGDGANYIRDTRVRLNIIYAPEMVKIDEYDNNRPLQIGSQLRLTCRSFGGNPKPTLYWYLNDKKMKSQLGNQISNMDTQIRTIDIDISRESNGQNITCKAFNTVNELTGVVSDVKTLNVHFPPSYLKVSLHGLRKEQIEENEMAMIECSSDPSNPAVELEWNVYDCTPDLSVGNSEMAAVGQISMGELDKRDVTPISEKNCILKKIDGVQETRSQNEFNGIISKIRYEFNATWEYNFYSFICSTRKTAFKGLKLQDQQRIVLPFKPQLLALTNKKEVFIKENENGIFDPIPFSNPSEFSIVWRRNGKVIKSWKDSSRMERDKNQVFITGSKGHLLYFKRVNDKSSGEYEAEVTNVVGTNNFQFNLLITKPPKIHAQTDKVHIEVKPTEETISLQVEADGIPSITNDMILWKKKEPHELIVKRVGNHTMDPLGCFNATGNDLNYKQFVQCDSQPTIMKSFLTIYRLGQKDIGTYECSIDNGVGQSKQTFFLLIPLSPQVTILEMHKKASGVIGAKRIELRAYITAEPLTMIKWSRKNKANEEKDIMQVHMPKNIPCGKSLMDPMDNSKTIHHYQTQIIHSEPGLYEITLFISTFAKEDFGTYKIQSGSSHGMIEVVGTSSPYMPINLRVIEQSGHAIRVAWTQAFNGGEKQIFQLKWRESGSDTYQYQDVVEEPSKQELNYTIRDLKSETLYEISISSRNELHGSSGFTEPILIRTSSIPKSLIINTEQLGKRDLEAYRVANINENAILIIVAVCVFGFVVLVINLLIISFLVKRRKKMAGLRAIHSIGGYGNDNASIPLSFTMNGHQNTGRNASLTSLNAKQHHLEDAYTLRNSEARYFNHSDDGILKGTHDMIEMSNGHMMTSNPRHIGLVSTPKMKKYQTQDPSLYDNSSHLRQYDFTGGVYHRSPDEKKTFSGYETGSDDTNFTVKDLIHQQALITNNNEGYYFDQNGHWKNDQKTMICLAKNTPTLIGCGAKQRLTATSQPSYIQKASSYEKGFNYPVPAARACDARKASTGDCCHQFLQSTPQLMNSFGKFRSESISNLDSPKSKSSILKRSYQPKNQPLLLNHPQNGNRSDGYSSQDDPLYEKNRYRERLRLIETDRKKTSKVILGSNSNLLDGNNISDSSTDAVSLAKLVSEQNQSCLI